MQEARVGERAILLNSAFEVIGDFGSAEIREGRNRRQLDHEVEHGDVLAVLHLGLIRKREVVIDVMSEENVLYQATLSFKHPRGYRWSVAHVESRRAWRRAWGT